MDRSWVTALLLVVAMLFSGCADRDRAGDGASPGVSPTTGPASPPGLIYCGTEQLGQGSVTLDARARDCLIQAYTRGEPVMFESTRPTIEGDPITTRIVVLGAGSVRLGIDVTRDRFSAPADRRVHTYACTTLTQQSGGQGIEISGCGTDGPFLV
jgi:hypothetical protein